jgi:nitroreductase
MPMNDTLKTILNRRSTRKYADTPITREEKDTLLQATFRAPTAGNMMLYSIIEVEDQSLKDKLAVTCDNQPFIATAPYVLLFLADYQRWIDLFDWSGAPQACFEKGHSPRQPGEGDLMLACCDALIAAQTAVIAAESMGIGSCYIGDIMENCETHRAMFDLPRYTFPICLLCFGRPFAARENPRLIKRFDREFIVQKDRYRAVDPADYPALMREAAAQFPHDEGSEAIKRYVQALYNRKFVSDFSVEMTRSVKKWVDIWTGLEV